MSGLTNSEFSLNLLSETKAQITAGCIMTSIQPFGASGGEKQESPPACPIAPPDPPEVSGSSHKA